MGYLEATFKVNRIQILFPADMPGSKNVMLCCLCKCILEILPLRKEVSFTYNYYLINKIKDVMQCRVECWG